MSRRLANKAARMARRRERGFITPSFPAGDFRPSSPYANGDRPDSEREVVTETLQGGTIRQTYMDPPTTHQRPRKATPAPEAMPEPEEPATAPARAPKVTYENGEEPSRFADYSMPGHPRKGIVFGAKV